MLPLEFRPILKRSRWGGRRFALLGKQLGEKNDYAESWELSDHGEDQTHVASGEYKGWSLRRLVEERNTEVFGRHAGLKQFPLLIKFLDARDRLSVQVHPDDAQAKKIDPDQNGKTEAWVVLDAEPDSRLFAGLRPGVTPGELRAAAENGQIESLLHSFEVTPGEVVFIPAGTVHAIGEGILLAEVQQMSDITFRLFDWGWVGSDGTARPLHIEESIVCTDFERGPVEPIKPDRREHESGLTDELVACDHFILRRYILENDFRLEPEDRFRVLMAVKGNGDLVAGDAAMRFSLGRTCLIPAAAPAVTIHPLGELTVLEATLP